MMNQKRSSHLQIGRYLLLPMLVALLFSFTISSAQPPTILQMDEGQSENPSILLNDSIIYYLDAKKVAADVLQSVNPDDIHHMQILKGAQAMAIFAHKAADGIIIITTRANKDDAEVKAFNKRVEAQVPKGKGDTKISVILGSKFEGATLEDVLILLDGEEVSANVVENLNSNRIESVEVLKGEAAQEQYGEKGKKGVLIITTK